MAQGHVFLMIVVLFALLSMVHGYSNDEYSAYESQEESDQSAQSMVGYDEDGAGFVTVSLYGLLIWQFMSLSFGMCLCGGITMCYNRFSQPTKEEAQW
eukprot:637223_1